MSKERFCLPDWKCYNDYRQDDFCNKLQLAERLLEESGRIRENAVDVVEKNRKTTDQFLEIRISETEFLIEEIERIRKIIYLEIETLNVSLNRVKNAIQALDTSVLNIVKQCLELRQGRIGIDLVCDQVETELQTEIKTIAGGRGILQKSKEQIEEMLRELRSSLYFIDKDLKEKLAGLVIDRDVLTLKPIHLDLSVYTGTDSLDPAVLTKTEWEKYTKESLLKASKRLNTSRPLRAQVDKVLQQIDEDLKEQGANVNEALRRRIEETKEAKHKLEMQHFEVVRQINELVLDIAKQEEAIAEKNTYLALAHTRLGRRAQRPGTELVRDEANLNINREVIDIQDAISQLQLTLAQSRAVLRVLLQTQIRLEEDINIKTNTIKIDEVDVLTLRQKIKY